MKARAANAQGTEDPIKTCDPLQDSKKGVRKRHRLRHEKNEKTLKKKKSERKRVMDVLAAACHCVTLFQYHHEAWWNIGEGYECGIYGLIWGHYG